MTRNKILAIGIATITGIGLALWIYTSIKKSRDESWRLLKLPGSSTKRNKKITIIKD